MKGQRIELNSYMEGGCIGIRYRYGLMNFGIDMFLANRIPLRKDGLGLRTSP